MSHTVTVVLNTSFFIFLLIPVFGYYGDVIQIGLDGRLQTRGSLLNMPNQSIQLQALDDILIVIDSPTNIKCNAIKYGFTLSLFCPDPYLYFRWEELFKRLLRKHSNIAIRNFPDRVDFDPTIPHVQEFDCPHEGTVLAYGDSQCTIENSLTLLTEKERDILGCERLFPMILPSSVTIHPRNLHIWTGTEQWEDLFLPCIAPLYVCGYGDPPKIINIEEREVRSIETHTHQYFNDIDFYHTFVRDTRMDCLMTYKHEHLYDKIKKCVFHQPIYNSTDFSFSVDMLKTSITRSMIKACWSDGVCGSTLQMEHTQHYQYRNLCPRNLTGEIIKVDKFYFHAKSKEFQITEDVTTPIHVEQSTLQNQDFPITMPIHVEQSSLTNQNFPVSNTSNKMNALDNTTTTFKPTKNLVSNTPIESNTIAGKQENNDFHIETNKTLLYILMQNIRDSVKHNKYLTLAFIFMVCVLVLHICILIICIYRDRAAFVSNKLEMDEEICYHYLKT
jgi:hypothetical protein